MSWMYDTTKEDWTWCGICVDVMLLVVCDFAIRIEVVSPHAFTPFHTFLKWIVAKSGLSIAIPELIPTIDLESLVWTKFGTNGCDSKG